MIQYQIKVSSWDIVGPGEVCKVWSGSFEESDCSVNKDATKRRKNGSNTKFWLAFGEKLNVRGELVRIFFHLYVVGVICKLSRYSL